MSSNVTLSMMLRLVWHFYCYVECHYAEHFYLYAECRHVEFRGILNLRPRLRKKLSKVRPSLENCYDCLSLLGLSLSILGVSLSSGAVGRLAIV